MPERPNTQRDERSVPQLISAVAADLSDLVRKESELLRAELSETVASLKAAALGMGVGAVLMLGAFLCVLAAVVIGLSNLMPPAWAALLVGVVCALVGATLLRGGAKKATPADLAPDRFVGEVRRDAEVIKEQMR